MKMKTKFAWPKLGVRYENVPTLKRKSHDCISPWVSLKLESERQSNFLVSFNIVINIQQLQTVGLEFIPSKVKGFPSSLGTGSSFCSMMPNTHFTFSICFSTVWCLWSSQDSTASIVTGLQAVWPRNKAQLPPGARDFHFSKTSRLVQNPTQVSTQWVLRIIFTQGTWPGHVTDHWRWLTAKVKNDWVYTTASCLCPHASVPAGFFARCFTVPIFNMTRYFIDQCWT